MLDRPLEIYRPFGPEETTVLRGFVASVRILGGMRFFSQVPSEASFKFEEGKGAWSEMQEPDDQDLRAAITELRKVYNAPNHTASRGPSRSSSAAFTSMAGRCAMRPWRLSTGISRPRSA